MRSSLRTSILPALLFSSACASAPPAAEAKPAEVAPAPSSPSATPTSSPSQSLMGWTPDDARVLVDGMLAECVTNAAWVKTFTTENGRPPAVRIAGVINKTMDHLNGNDLTGPLEKAMVDSHELQVLPAADSLAKRAIREEQDQAAMGLTEGDVEIGKQVAADFVITISLGSALDRQADAIKQTYTATFRIVDSSTGAMACVAMPKAARLVNPPATPSPAP